MNGKQRTDFHIRSMINTDVHAVVDVHLLSFQGFFLSYLGARFLIELYSSIIMDTSGICFVCENNNNIIGFVAGTSKPEEFYHRLLNNRWWRFGVASFVPLIKRPTILPRLLQVFRMSKQSPLQENCGTLMSIAVAPDEEGKGIGQALLKAFLNEAKNRGLWFVNLSTDKNNNDAVNAFYIRNGFQCNRSYTTSEGRVMNEFHIDIRNVSIA